MGKAVGNALKFVAIAASIVAAVPTLGASLGLSAALLTGISVAAALGSSLLAPKPKAPSVSSASADRLFASIDPRTPRKIVFGRTAMATDIRDQEYTDSQGYFHRFVVVASHRVQAIEELWFDDKRVWTAGGGVEGEAAGYLTVTPILEGSAANAITISGRMGASRRYTGCAYLHLRYKLTGNSKKSESPYAQSIPSRLTIRGKGALVYDPRLDSTAGGSGPQRANDQSTWAWSDSASRNPALQELWYELGWRINGKLAVGKGVPPGRLDLASYIAAANACDETVALAAGGTEPRYRSDGVFGEADQPSLVRDNLKAAMNAVLDDMDGKIRLTVIGNDLATPIADFTADDIIDGVRWDQTPPLADTFNVVRGGYTDPSDQSLYQLVDYPEVTLPSVDGIERVDPFDLPLVQSPSQAQRLAKQRLQRMQYPGLFTADFQATAWRVQKGDIVRLTFPALGWYQKLFRVIDITVRLDGVVPMVLREEHASIYAWAAGEAAAVTAAAPTTYDWTKNPLFADVLATGRKPTRGPAPPADPLDGDIWVDTSVTPNVTRYRMAGSWVIGANLVTQGVDIGVENNATAGENQILNASLDGSAANWAVSGTAYYVAANPGTPTPGIFVFPQGVGAATANSNTRRSTGQAKKLFASANAFKETGVTGSLSIVIYWFKTDGSVSTTPSNIADILPSAAAVWTKGLTKEFPVPDDAAFYVAQIYANITGANNAFAGGLRVAATEPAADVTANAQVSIEMTTEKTIAADYQGTLTGTLPVVFSPSVRRAGVSIKQSDTVTYVLSEVSGGSVTVSAANGASDKGDVSVTAMTGNKVTFTLGIAVGGIAQAPHKGSLTKQLGAAPTGGGSGGGGGSIATVGADRMTASTTYQTAHSADPPSITLTSGQKLKVRYSGDYQASQGGALNNGSGRRGVFLAEYSANGGTSWTAFGAEVQGSIATKQFFPAGGNGEPIEQQPGHVDVSYDVSGLSAGTYLCRLSFKTSISGYDVALMGENIVFQAAA